VGARATAVGSGLSGAILRFVETQPGGLPSAFADPASTFLVNATTFYTRHLALAASAVYFTPAEGGLTVQADLTTVVQRLFLQYVPAPPARVARRSRAPAARLPRTRSPRSSS
jgi:hypothetical protein